MSQLPVLIIGAGPVGLSLAVTLMRKGIACEVCELLSELSPEARASTFHPPTLEMFAEWNVLAPLLARGFKVGRLQFWERANRELLADFDYQLIANDTPYPYRLQCPQSVLTRILKPIVEGSPFVKVHMAHRLVHFTDCDAHVEATFETPNGLQTMRGAILCGADGSRSVVRKQLGIGFEGMTYEDRFLLIATNIDLQPLFPGIGPVSYHFDPVEWVIMLTLPDVTRFVFRLRDDEDAAFEMTEAPIRRRMQGLIGDMPFEIKAVSNYNTHQRVADTFHVGRVVLLGDAAHINNPAGGTGMNSGIHDAHNLAQKLPLVLATHALEPLARYAQERRAVALERIRRDTHKNYGDLTAADEAARQRRNAEYRAIAADPRRAREFLLRSAMLEERI